jgi:hypothetical protein
MGLQTIPTSVPDARILASEFREIYKALIRRARVKPIKILVP